MSQGITKNRSRRDSDSYAALKSCNEIYFQMASIFKQVAKTEDDLASGIVEQMLSTAVSEISLENSF